MTDDGAVKRRWADLPAHRQETACFVLFERAEEIRRHIESLQARGVTGVLIIQARMVLEDVEAALDLLRDVASAVGPTESCR